MSDKPYLVQNTASSLSTPPRPLAPLFFLPPLIFPGLGGFPLDMGVDDYVPFVAKHPQPLIFSRLTGYESLR